ncbi:FtsX-like permease family protein [Streptosporangium sandarakinum]|uniref:FtsX-like permease family protein n=1 Tax=Streptosporangium sandarakinum TaxID=1260955 RepID=UPI0033ACA774
MSAPAPAMTRTGPTEAARSRPAAFLAALRISRREIWRARARSALIIVMIGLPVLAVTAALTVSATRDIRVDERLTMELGAADARLKDTGSAVPVRQTVDGEDWTPRDDGTRRPRSQAEIQTLLGPGWRAIPMSRTFSEYRTNAAHSEVMAWEVDLRDPLTAGMLPLLRGRYPRSADEVAVTASVQAAVGTTIRYGRGDTPRRVVGTVAEQPVGFHRAVIGLPGSLLPASSTGTDGIYWLVDAPSPVSWKETLRLNKAGMTVLSPAVLGDPPEEGNDPGQAVRQLGDRYTVGGVLAVVPGILLVVIEVALLAGPAFAVGVRRRRRELALLSAQGGSARHLKLVVLADGLTLGSIGAALGVAGGIGVAGAIVPFIGSWPAGELGPFDVPAGQVALVAALGMLSGVAAAVVPAVQAARTDAAAALSGRRAGARDRAGRPLPGLVLLVMGAAVMVYGVWTTDWVIHLGGVLGLLGLTLVTPRLVQLAARPAGRLPLPFRLAVRDASRNRGRTAPAIVAVLAAAAAFSTVSVGVTSSRELAWRMNAAYDPYPPGTLAVYGDDVTEESWRKIRPIVERTLPGVPLLEAYHSVDEDGRSVVLQWRGRVCEGCGTMTGPLGDLPVGGPDLLRFLMGRADPAAEAALAQGKAVIFNPQAVRGGEIRLSAWSPGSGAQTERTGSVHAVAATVPGPSLVLGVLPVSAITELGFTPRLSHLMVDPAVTRVSPAQEQRLSGPVRAVTLAVAVRLGNSSDNGSLISIMWVMAALSSLVVLGGTFAAVGLAAADARPDLGTLTAVGARPGTRRLTVAGHAMFIAGLGVPLGLLIGLLPGAAMAGQMGVKREHFPMVGLNGVPFESIGAVLSVPWPVLVAVGIGLPLLAALAAGAFTRTRVTLTRRVT